MMAKIIGEYGIEIEMTCVVVISIAKIRMLLIIWFHQLDVVPNNFFVDNNILALNKLANFDDLLYIDSIETDWMLNRQWAVVREIQQQQQQHQQQ